MTVLTVAIIIPNTDVLVTLAMMELGGLSFVMLAFVFTALFTKAKSAANAAGMITSFIAFTYYVQGGGWTIFVEKRALKGEENMTSCLGWSSNTFTSHSKSTCYC